MEHPRIALLRSQVLSLPVDGHCRAVLLKSIEYLREQIVARPRGARELRVTAAMNLANHWRR